MAGNARVQGKRVENDLSGLSCSMSIDFILGEEIHLLVKVGWRLPLTRIWSDKIESVTEIGPILFSSFLVIIRSRVWPEGCVGPQTCCVKLKDSSSWRKLMQVELDLLSTCKLKSPVVINAPGVVVQCSSRLPKLIHSKTIQFDDRW